MLSFHKWGKAALDKLGQLALDCNLKNSTKQDWVISSSWQFHNIHTKRVWDLPPCKVYFAQWRTAGPIHDFSWKQHLPFSQICLSYTWGKWANGLPRALCPLAVLVISLVWNPLQSVLLIGEVYLAWKCFLFTSREKLHLASSSNQCLMIISQTPQMRDWELPCCKVYSTQWMYTSPIVCLLWKGTI